MLVEAYLVGKISERARSAGVGPEEEAPAPEGVVGLVFEGFVALVFIVSLSERELELLVEEEGVG